MKSLFNIITLLFILSILSTGCQEQNLDPTLTKIIQLEKSLSQKGFDVAKNLYEEEYSVSLSNQKYLEILSTLENGNLLLIDRLILEAKLEQGQKVKIDFSSIKKINQPDGSTIITKYILTKEISSFNEYQAIQDSIDQSLGIPKNLDKVDAGTELERTIIDNWVNRKSDKEFSRKYSEILENNPSLRTAQTGCHDGGGESGEGDSSYGAGDSSPGGCYSDETYYVPIYAYRSDGTRVRQGTFVIHVVRQNNEASVSTGILSNSITLSTTSTNGMGSYAYVSDNGTVNWHVSISFQVQLSNNFQNLYQDGYVEYDGFYTPDGFGHGTKTGEAEGGVYFGNHASSDRD